MNKKTLTPPKSEASKKEPEEKKTDTNRAVTAQDLPILKAAAYDLRKRIAQEQAYLNQIEAKIEEFSVVSSESIN
jgi:hypothetical protein